MPSLILYSSVLLSALSGSFFFKFLKNWGSLESPEVVRCWKTLQIPCLALGKRSVQLIHLFTHSLIQLPLEPLLKTKLCVRQWVSRPLENT